MTPLYNHTNPDNAYLVKDYPYGFKERCCIRFWIEESNTRGFRFVSQTEHPRKLIWNNPKRGTYHRLAACLYLDDKSHVQCAALNEYSDADKFLEFLQNFPDYKLSLSCTYFIHGKRSLCARTCRGEAVISINKVPQVPGLSEIETAKISHRSGMSVCLF